MRLREFLHRYFIVHKCAGCSEILEYERHEEAFCNICKLAWNTAKTENCGDCYKEISECSCMPKKLSNSGALILRKLCYYSADRAGEPQNRLIYKLKNIKNKRYAKFVALQLSVAVKEELKNLIDIGSSDLHENVLITYVPRSKKAILNNGFDQSELICNELAAMLGIKCVKTIRRGRYGKEQKNLTKVERFKNTEALFSLDSQTSVKGKYIILFDDIVTTGASMTGCVKALRRGKARGILCFCIALDKLKR